MISERGDYLTDLLSSVDTSSSVIFEEKSISIRKIKDEAENLGKIKEILENFEKSQSKIFQQHTKEHIGFVKQLGREQRKVLNILFLNYKNKLTSLFEYHSINESIDILAYYLGLLKVTLLSKDYATSRRLINKFVAQDGINLSFLIDNVKEFEGQIKDFRLSYLTLISTISGYLELEEKANIQFKNLTQLSQLNKKQKQLLHSIGTEFTKVSKQLLEDKGYREFLKRN